MKTASVTEAKNSLSALIDSLKSGSPVLIVDRGRPVARLEPITGGADHAPDGRLSRLLREGAVRPRRTEPPRAIFRTKPPALRAGVSAVDLVIQERRQGW